MADRSEHGAAQHAVSLPVVIVTGFLGSGKTHLLNRWIRAPELSRAAFIINEFGAVALDHRLIEAVEGDVQVLKNGCVCCQVRDDLAAVLRDLWDKRCEGTIPPFERVVIETTGLADPTPLLATVLHEPVLRHHFHPGTVITTVDPTMIATDAAALEEFQHQIMLADHIVLTKGDLFSEAAMDAARDAVSALNATATLEDGRTFAPSRFAEDANALHEARLKTWLRPSRPDATRAHAAVQSFTLSLDRTIDWTVFGVWLSMLLHVHGERILRVKGIVSVGEDAPPVVVNGVRHTLYRPYHLTSADPGWNRTELVFITRNMEEAAVRASFEAFCGLAV